MAGAEKADIEFQDGWTRIKGGIDEQMRFLEGETGLPVKEDDQKILSATVYTMCTQKAPHDYAKELYEEYKKFCDSYLVEKVVPVLESLHGEQMLRELVKRWNTHKLFLKWCGRVFTYVDRYYVTRHKMRSLKDVGMSCFHQQVYNKVLQAEVNGATPVAEVKMKDSIKDAVLALIDKDREGEMIDRPLIKSVQGFFAEIVGQGGGNSTEADERGEASEFAAFLSTFCDSK